jgi:hypothetical protein
MSLFEIHPMIEVPSKNFARYQACHLVRMDEDDRLQRPIQRLCAVGIEWVGRSTSKWYFRLRIRRTPAQEIFR